MWRWKRGYVSTSIPQSQIDNCANSGNEIANINGVLKCGDYTSNKGDVVQEDDLGFAWCSSGADIKHVGVTKMENLAKQIRQQTNRIGMIIM